METKTCSKCRQVLLRSEFFAEPRHSTGLRSRCKACHGPSKNRDPAKKAAYARQRAERASEYVPRAERQRLADEKKANAVREKVERAAERQAGARPQVGSKAWYLTATPDEAEAYKARKRAQYSARYAADPARERQRTRVAKIVNPGTQASTNARRVSRIKDKDDGTLTYGLVQRMFAHATQCPYCGCALNPGNKSLDHMNPIAKGGMHSANNALICCITCNQRKKMKAWSVWLGELDSVAPIHAMAHLHPRHP